MARYLFLLLGFLTMNGFAQLDSLEVESELTDVTVYRTGAQIQRSVKIVENKGSHIIIFKDLPFQINEDNVQIRCNKMKHIQSIKLEKIYGSSIKKTKLIEESNKEIKSINQKTKRINMEIKVLQMEEKLLMDNNRFNSATKSISLSDLKQTVDYYKTKLTTIKQKTLSLEVKKAEYGDEKKEIYRAIQTERVRTNVNSSRLIVAIDNSSNLPTEYEISYFLNEASWYPDYNFRVENTTKPLTIDFKANIFQSTGENWKGVNLTLSTTTPELNPTQKKLENWIVEEQTKTEAFIAPKYMKSVNGSCSLRGVITDASTGETIPMANVVVKSGQTIVQGGATDFDGRFVISPMSPGTYDVEISFIGYQTKEINGVVLSPSKATSLAVSLEEDGALMEVVLNYEEPIIDPDVRGTTFSMEKINGSYTGGGGGYSNYNSTPKKSKSKIRSVVDNILNDFKQNITHQEYKIKVPFTILKDGKENEILIKTTEVDAQYTYKTIPKLGNEVFLQANIEDWQKLELLEGKASIFLSGQYIGQTCIETDQMSDTLNIQLGVDEQIQVKRVFNKEVGGKTFSGNKVKENLAFNIKVKNNKDYPISVIVEDQIPITERKDITIELLESDSGKINAKTGKISWDLKIEPRQQKEVNFSFFARYPKEYAY